MLAESKFSKYVVYALGEITLVVIGILIALQINNWDQKQQLAKEELKILKSLHNEMQENFILFEEAYSRHLRKRDTLKTLLLLNFDEYSITDLDTLGKGYINSQTYNPSFSVYDTLVSSGKIELISNDPLKYRVSKYKDLVADFQEGEIVARKNTRDHNWMYLTQLSEISAKNRFGFHTRTDNEKVEEKKQYLLEYKSPKFQNAMTLLHLNMNEIVSDGRDVQTEITVLISLLNAEISKNE